MAVDSETYMAVCEQVSRLQAENEALRARVSELERTGSTSTSCPFCFDQMRNSYILRKQAEAVEKFGQEIGVFDPEYDDQEYAEVPRREVKAYAQRLRQQADEIEKAGGEK